MKKYYITISGYGAEVTIGSVTEDQKLLLSEDDDRSHTEIVLEDLEKDKPWNEFNNEYHMWGANDYYKISISDEDKNIILEINSDEVYDFDTENYKMVDWEFIKVDRSKDLLMCVASEKGLFFEGEFSTKEDFCIEKLKLKIDGEIIIGEYECADILSKIEYEGEEIINLGGSTDGKVFDVCTNFS
jgi:hypothetical protein